MILSIIPMFFTLMWGGVQSTIDTSTVNDLDIDRYLGEWYEVARYDNRFERELVWVTANYSMRDNSTIRVINRGFNPNNDEWKQSEGRAKMTSEGGRLRVSFFLWFYSDYNVMEIADDYSWALVGSSSPDLLWILARERQLPPETMEHILTLARQRGYDTSLLIYPQTTHF